MVRSSSFFVMNAEIDDTKVTDGLELLHLPFTPISESVVKKKKNVVDLEKEVSCHHVTKRKKREAKLFRYHPRLRIFINFQ